MLAESHRQCGSCPIPRWCIALCSASNWSMLVFVAQAISAATAMIAAVNTMRRMRTEWLPVMHYLYTGPRPARLAAKMMFEAAVALFDYPARDRSGPAQP